LQVVLGRLQSFLPRMKEANDSLADAMRERPQEEFDIEAVDEEDQHVEMVRCDTHAF